MNLSSNADHYQWILPDGTSTYEENFPIPYTQNGEINVTLIAYKDCFSDTEQQVLALTGVTDPVSDQMIYIYPNPAQNFFILETVNYIDELHLHNILGAKLLTESNLVPGKHSIPIHHLLAGGYVLKIHLENQVIPKRIFINN
jgi:hypothetical protein